MNKVISISLCLLLLATSLKDLIIYANFHVNRDYIAEFLCINRAIPESTCHGTCHLNKTIQESKEQESQLPISDKEERTNMTYVFSIIEIKPNVAPPANLSGFANPLLCYKYLHYSNTFRPPDLS